VEAVEEVEDLGAGRRVEVAGRLVGEEDAGPRDQGPGDGHSLALASGQFRGAVIEPIGQADAIEQAPRPIKVAFLGIALFDQRGKQHIFKNRTLRQKVMFLEDEAHAAVAKPGEVAFRKLKRVGSIERHPSGSRRFKRAEDVQQGALSRTGGAHDRR
jgi:hypothetical protein